MDLPRLEGDTEKYLGDLVRYLKEDSHANPSLKHIEDPSQRREEGDTWLRLRESQLRDAEVVALLEIHNAQRAGFLDNADVCPTIKRYQEAFDNLKEEARAKYREAAGLEATAQASG